MNNILLSDLLKEELSNEKNLVLVPITETDVHRVMTNYMDIGFIILSANRTPEAEFGANYTEEQKEEQRKTNKKNYEELKNILRSCPYGYVPTWGGYKETLMEPDPDNPGQKRPVYETDEEGKPKIDPKTGKKIEKKVDTAEPEPSFIITGTKKGKLSDESVEENANNLKEFGLNLARKYNQDTILWKPPDSLDTKAYYLKKDGSVDMTFEGPHSIEDLKKDFYTYMAKSKRRFTLESAVTRLLGPTNKEKAIYMQQGPAGMQEAIRRYGEIFFRF